MRKAYPALASSLLGKELSDLDDKPNAEVISPVEPEVKAKSDLREYRQWLVAAEQKGQADFDKTVLTLSGGALGISFAFVKDIIGPGQITQPLILLAAWICWALSCFAVLASFHYSNLAVRRAIEQCDSGKIHCEPPGGYYTKITKFLNASGGVLFFGGVFLMALFVYFNLSTRTDDHGHKQATPASHSAT